MIYRIFIVLLLLSVFIYYIFCFLQIFEVVRFTDEGVEVQIPQMFIPFYYLFKKAKPVKEVKHENEPEPQVLTETVEKTAKKPRKKKTNEKNNE